MGRTVYDLALFLALNEEYASKPIVPKARPYDPAAVADFGSRLAASLSKRFPVAGKRVLEIGCGRGEVARALAAEHGCEVCGLDIKQYPEWKTESQGRVTLRVLDISRQDSAELGQFDFIYSSAVWEHMEHPFAALAAVKQLLAPGGRFYLYANLYRGQVASHRYRDVFFPWPHLLFSDEVWVEFYRSLGQTPRPPAWVNKLTAAHYLMYLDLLGLKAEKVWYDIRKIDEEFYTRFEDVLGRYPRFDLERDFIHALVAHGDQRK
jgi:cyclopropane fatty-acyl-phospholipid synthase-like methyltransferase